ncbi:hypothetical protein ACJIZ3_019012 [Penstemon smallii]|uniref:non-specific serine/threonine protein kinase n=1 Tax=Penstemon smallii TaxID=265156 RepID=A0ABD3T011_9LAMI
MASIILIFLILCTHFYFFSTQSLNFTYHGFNNSNLQQEGATLIQPTGALRLTTKTQNIIGHAFHPTPIQFSNSSSFSTHFVFQIRPSTSNRGGYGLAFILSPSTQFDNPSAAHYLGIFNSENVGNPSNHIFMVEFDTVNGYREESDSIGNHVGINVNGMNSTASQPAAYYVDGSAATEEFDMGTGMAIQAWIEYDGVQNILNVTVCPSSVLKPSRPLMSEALDLSYVVMENMYVGFSASTGVESSSHYILGWSFRVNGLADDLDHMRLPFVQPERSSSMNAKVKRALIATFSCLVVVLIVVFGIMIFYRRVMKFEVLEEWELDCPHRFNYRDLYKATKGFKESELLGVGGFGAVYKGVLLDNGVEIAVKKIMSNGMREFSAEIESLGRLRHKNLVNLQGWCKSKNDLLLIYDFVPNGSLASLLYNSEIEVFLNWEQRFNIVKGVASGLLYLHEEWEQVVIHRDVKSSNVLIDRDMNARLGDFGLARLYDHGKNSHTTSVVGTIGYIAPELTRIGKASTSSDVFAYGILLLEVACGRAPIDYKAEKNVVLVDWVVECMKMGSIFDVVDVRLKSSYEVEEMELVLGLGLICSHPNPEVRPTMRDVMKYLNGDEIFPVFDRLSSAGSRRVDEDNSRLLALGSRLYTSFSGGQMSSTSLDTGR